MGDGQRVDNFLLRELKGVPRTHVVAELAGGVVAIEFDNSVKGLALRTTFGGFWIANPQELPARSGQVLGNTTRGNAAAAFEYAEGKFRDLTDESDQERANRIRLRIAGRSADKGLLDKTVSRLGDNLPAKTELEVAEAAQKVEDWSLMLEYSLRGQKRPHGIQSARSSKVQRTGSLKATTGIRGRKHSS